MLGILIAFLSSFTATLLIIRFKHLHEQFTSDTDLLGPQKFHIDAVPRIGGISISIGLFLATLSTLFSAIETNIGIILLICAIPTFAIGLAEDLTKIIGIRTRLLFTAISATLFVYLIPAHITKFDIPYLDIIFSFPIMGPAISMFAIAGLVNAYNIIDGFNGLSSMVGIIALMAIAYVSFLMADPLITYLSLIMVAAILGFFIWNYPRGLIFLGDGGAYLIGFWISSLSILLCYKHQEVSPWFALLINIYPVVETLFSMYRRIILRGRSPGHPDGMHFHSLIYRRVLNTKKRNFNSLSPNSKTAPYLWALAILGVTPAVLYWHSTTILATACIFFITLYLWLYTKIIRLKTPRWLHLT